MDHLWAPWRMAYVAAPKPPAGDDPCFICAGLAANDDRNNLLLRRSEHAVTLLNKFPYNNGHLLVAPRAHKAGLNDLTHAEVLDIQSSLATMVTLLGELMTPDGFNIGVNLGKAAGAGLPGHVHWHIVPRWNGDTNFMPVCADVKVIVQSLDSLYDMLSAKLLSAKL